MRSKKFNQVKPYTYFLIRKSDNYKYHGVRWGNKKSPIEDIGKIYFTSSKKIKNDFRKDPNSFIVKLKWTFESVHEAREYEAKVNEKIYKKKDWLNKNAFPAIYNEIPVLLGKKHSIETKKKISDWNKKNNPMRGKKHTLETKRKITLSLLGRKHSIESKDKMSKNRKGKYCGEDHKNFGKKLNKNHPFILACKMKKGVPLSEETKKKLSLAHTGKTISVETRKKHSKNNIGSGNPMYGKKHLSSTIMKIRKRAKERWTLEARKNISGINHHNFGKNLTEDHKIKIGLSVAGEKNGMYGKKHSEETKNKIRLKAIERRESVKNIQA